MPPILKILPAFAFLTLAGCDYPPPSDKPMSVSDLGVATPAHPITNTAQLENAPGAPMQLPVPNTAVPRATDAGANDEGGPIALRE